MEKKEINNILIKNFNETVLILTEYIVTISNDIYTKSFIPLIKTLKNQNSKRIIELFIVNILEYESYIFSEDEEINNDFFTGKKFSTKNKLLQLFNFNSIWSILSDENKNSTKLYMQLLCKIANKYLQNNNILDKK
jgi:hypothetical protein